MVKLIRGDYFSVGNPFFTLCLGTLIQNSCCYMTIWIIRQIGQIFIKHILDHFSKTLEKLDLSEIEMVSPILISRYDITLPLNKSICNSTWIINTFNNDTIFAIYAQNIFTRSNLYLIENQSRSRTAFVANSISY